MKELDLISRAYEKLERVTPLKTDCGKLCDSACCKGDGEIWLLPGEEKMFENSGGFELKKYSDGDRRVICKGSCADYREKRPYYCRIFPYFPHIARREDGSLSVKLFLDPRAERFCPFSTKGNSPDRQFARAVRLSVRILCEDDKYIKHFSECTEFLDEMSDFSDRLFGEDNR